LVREGVAAFFSFHFRPALPLASAEAEERSFL